MKFIKRIFDFLFREKAEQEVYYIQGSDVLPQPLSAYDVIEMGESTFLFVPFCGEHYMWEDDK